MAKNGTIAYVAQLPLCDICKYVGNDSEKDSPRTALYDVKTKNGPWAFVCEEHRTSHAVSAQLGLGWGQKLEVRA